ncbi:MAG: signal peptide peptidase SppA [Desulfovibrio sp.]|uniref:signal peptide peptidase SppA n=1 Tax=Desulfovibrio sp. TaxID=885 RepID=UPI0039E440E0
MTDKDFSQDEPLSMAGAMPSPANGNNTAHCAPQVVAQSAPEAPCTAACPLAQIPAGVWKTLLHRPFRKRHPIIFWCGIVLFFGLLGGFITKAAGDEGGFTGGGSQIALVSVNGPILNVEPTLEWLRKVARNPSVKGVLVRVDSPGGGAAASQEVYDALKELAQKMPVAVSMGSVAASGGLMVSMAGQRVFANPSTVTGSIGVRMDVPQFQGLMDKVGVGQETLVVGTYKDAASYMRPMTPEQRAYFQSLLNDMYGQFVDIVAQGRNMPREQVVKLANGKVYTGQEALKLGLVDEMGGRDQALRWLAQKTGVPVDRKLLTRPKEGNWLGRGLTAMLGLDADAINGLAALVGLSSAGGQTDPRTPAFLFQF